MIIQYISGTGTSMMSFAILVYLLVIPSLAVSQITEVSVSESDAVYVYGLSGTSWTSVCYEGTYGNWSSIEARVTCRHLEYLDGEAVSLTEDDVGDITEAVIFDFDCDGGEASLADCRYGDVTMTDAGCGSKQYAGAICSSTDCGGIFTSKTGNISSPNYPNRYPVEASCDYIITVPAASAMTITFHSFDTEYTYDILYYGKGTNPPTNPEDSPDAFVLTGDIIPDPITLNTNTTWLRFVSDDSVNQYGFSLTWEALDIPPCHYRYTNLTGSITSPNYPNQYPAFADCTYIIDIPNVEHITVHFHDFSLEYRHDFLYYGVGTVPSVDASLRSITGSRRTPDPFSVPSSSIWFIFQSDGSDHFRGFSITWDTRTDAPERSITDVSIANEGGLEAANGLVRLLGLVDGIDTWTDVCYTGSNRDWSDTEATLICRFHGFGRGEATHVTIDPESSWVLNNFQCAEDVTSLNNCSWDLVHSTNGCGNKLNAGVRCFPDPCDAVFTTPIGSIQSPNFPLEYPPLSNCTYHINVTEATRLVITFETLHLESRHDTIRFYGTNPANAPADDHIYTVSGWGDKDPIGFYTGSLWLLFTSDRTVSYSGFNLTWTSMYGDSECNKEFTSAEGNFSSPNYPDNYPHLTRCIYIFNITNTTQIEFSIEDFSTREWGDFLYYGTGTDYQLEGDDYFTGSNVWSSLVLYGGSAWFVFQSDVTVSERGFYISWKARTENIEGTPCGQTFTSRTGTIRSPNYPDRYPGDADCVYVIDIPSADRIAVNFLSFDLESGYDYLNYGVGNQPTSDWSTHLTGSFIPDPVELMTNSLWFRFTSDGGVNNFGFSFTWRAIEDSADCHGYYTQPTGNITSPNYPHPYPGFSNCSYIITVAGANHITISFLELNLEVWNDYLYFGVGNVPNYENAIGSFSGYVLPSNFSLRTSSMWFVFETNGRGSDMGFFLTWDTTADAPESSITGVSINNQDGDYSTGYVTIDHVDGLIYQNWAHICYEDEQHTWSDVEAKLVCLYAGFDEGTAIPFDEWNNNGWILDNFICPTDAVSLNDCSWDNVTNSVEGCGARQYAGVRCSNSPCDGNFSSQSGFIYSPDYPDEYPPKSNCTYLINVPGATRLVLTFHVFHLEYDHDKLQYFEHHPASAVIGNELTGSGDQASIEFYSNTLWLRFLTDSTVQYTGFNISWNASYESCNHRYTAESGEFSSPNFPNNYPHLANCTYYFAIPDAISITFYPIQFSLEATSDMVYFGNSSQVTADGALLYTETDIPRYVNVVGSYAWLHFTSDLTISDLGFLFTWEAVLETTNCGQTFTTRTGLIESPNYPNRYPNDIYCTYMIHVDWANTIKIVFQAFDLEPDYDTLRYGLVNGTDDETTELTGSLIPEPIELMTNSMWFEFTTDSSQTYYGFAFTWEAFAAPSCNQRYTSPNGTIRSPEYPNPYPEFSNCTYILAIPDVTHITLRFREMDLEYRRDVLYYGVSDVPSVRNAAGRFTGYNTPDPITIPVSSILWFIFESNGQGSDTGFSFSWDTTTDASEVEITDIRVDNGHGLVVKDGYVSLFGLSHDNWARVCYEGTHTWGINEANVVCQAAEFSNGTAVRLDDEPMSDVGWILMDFDCDADTTSLNGCTRGALENKPEGCGANNYAGVSCYNAPCGRRLTNQSGIIQTPNYPLRYPAFSNCTYYINVPNASRLTISFVTFRLESRHDYLAYYGTNPGDGEGHHGVLTGLGNQAPMVFYTGQLWMRFTSDQSVEYNGFRLRYLAEYESCNMKFTSEAGNFSSPNYPGNYPALANCTYVFNIPGAINIHFLIHPYDLQSGTDKLYFGTGNAAGVVESTEYLTGSQNTATLLEAIGGQFWFRFTSDLTISGNGFTIGWIATIDKTPMMTTKPPHITTKPKPPTKGIEPTRPIKPTKLIPTTGSKGTGGANRGDGKYNLSDYHRRALIGGYVAAAILLLILIVCGIYIVHIRKRGDESIHFRLSSFRSNGKPEESIDHHNAVFDANEDTVIGKTDPI